MRAVYLQECKFLPDKIIHQVKQLNTKVLDELMPDVITAIKQEYGYLKDINQPLQPIMRPLNVNNAGSRQLPSITTIWQ